MTALRYVMLHTLGDEGPRCEAYVPDRRWNGFLCPVLTMAGLDALRADIDTWPGYRTEITDSAFVVHDPDSDEPQTFPIEAHACLDGARGADFGGGWVWCFADEGDDE